MFVHCFYPLRRMCAVRQNTILPSPPTPTPLIGSMFKIPKKKKKKKSSLLHGAPPVGSPRLTPSKLVPTASVCPVNAKKRKAEAVNGPSSSPPRAKKLAPVDTHRKISYGHSLSRKRPSSAGSADRRPRSSSFNKVTHLCQPERLEVVSAPA